MGNIKRRKIALLQQNITIKHLTLYHIKLHKSLTDQFSVCKAILTKNYNKNIDTL
jgi:hypothetical protein